MSSAKKTAQVVDEVDVALVGAGIMSATLGIGSAIGLPLAGVLVVVCWYMAEKEAFVHLITRWRGAAVLIPTFGLTVFEDLTSGIITGCVIAALLAVFDRWQRRSTN